MSTQVEIRREVVPLTPQVAADRMAAIVAILQKYLPACVSPLTPTPFTAKLEVKSSVPQGEGER